MSLLLPPPLLLPLLLLPPLLLPLLLVLALLLLTVPVPPAAAAAPPPDAPAYFATNASYNGSSSKPPLGALAAPPTVPLPPLPPPLLLALLLAVPTAAPGAFLPAAPALGPCKSSPPASSQYCRAVSKNAADSCGVACSGSSRGGVTRRHSARPCTWRPAARSRQRQPPMLARRAHRARARMAWAASAGEGAATWSSTHAARSPALSNGAAVTAYQLNGGKGPGDAGRRGRQAPCCVYFANVCTMLP